MNYREAVAYLLEFADFERSSAPRREAEAFALDRIRSLLRRLGDPQDGRRTVHVAGSKGKGSTAAMIESILRAADYSTGLFTSPHLHEFRERIEIDGEALSEEAFAALVERLQPLIVEELEETPGRLSTFEILTAMGYAAFAEAGVDVQVIEVGIGGRLDCTNVMREKDVAVITAMSFEHTDVLGAEMGKIAAEKAGIITASSKRAVLAPQRSAEARDVVRHHADDVPAPLQEVSELFRWQAEGVERWGQWFRLRRTGAGMGWPEKLFLTPLLGGYQIENAATAVSVVEALQAEGLPIPGEALHTGLATVRWPGRMEILEREPSLVVDGAHNLDSLERALESFDDYFPHERLIVVLGMLGDKALAEMAARIRDRAWGVVLTQPDHPRARPAEDLAEAFSDWDGRVLVVPEVRSALITARDLARAEDLIGVLGSLFVAAEARAAVQAESDGTRASARADRWI